MKKILIQKLAKLAATKLLALLVTKVPFFAWGPAGVVASYVIEKILVKALELTFLGGMIGYIFLDTRRDLNVVEKLIKEINEHEGELSKVEIDSYNEKLAKAGRDLIRFGTIS